MDSALSVFMSMSSPYLLPAIGLCILAQFLYVVIRSSRKHSIAHLPGPKPGPWLAGNLPELLRTENVGDTEFMWNTLHGLSMRIKGGFGSDILLTADPKALQYILNATGYHFPKSPQKIATFRLVTGRGLAFAEGAQHSRQRKIMNPAFSYSSFRVFLPLFRDVSQKLVSQWRSLILKNNGAPVKVDSLAWFSRTALDGIGSAAFNYDFGALDNEDGELPRTFRNLSVDSFYNRSDYTFAFEALWGYIPTWLIPFIQNLPTRRLQRLNNYMTVSRRIAKSIVDTQSQSYVAGKQGGKDIMSIFIRANLSEDPKNKLDEDEMLSQLTTMMIAGHETTATTLAWIVHELSKHPEFQTRIREEIKQTRVQVARRGDAEFSIADLDSMKCLLAVIKETLRFHPIIVHLDRVASRDDVIPLSTQITVNGEKITSIPVSKGQKILLSITGYNRVEAIWGEDAHVWRPERFLDKEGQTERPSLGMVANLPTFGSGVRGCIGWRFALIEMQIVLAELLEVFEMSAASGNPEIARAFTGLMAPMVKGAHVSRAELPITVTAVI